MLTFDADGEEQPVSLYLDLEPGHKPDLEAVARAALAFAGAIRETAYIFDPSMTVRVELLSGTDGSLSLNSLIRAVKPRDIITRKRLIAVAIAAAIWFRMETGRWLFDEILNYITGTHHSDLSQDDRAEIAKLVADSLEKQIAQKQIGQVYRELETDPAVKGVGATTETGKRPESIVPRSEFARRSGGASDVIETTEIIKQTRRSHQSVTVIRPVLEPGKGKWQFSGPYGRFFASVRDQRFLDDLLNGRLAVPMRSGIRMDVDIDTAEENREGVWVPLTRTVIAVRGIHQAAEQEGLSLPLPRGRPDQQGRDEANDHDEC